MYLHTLGFQSTCGLTDRQSSQKSPLTSQSAAKARQLWEQPGVTFSPDQDVATRVSGNGVTVFRKRHTEDKLGLLLLLQMLQRYKHSQSRQVFVCMNTPWTPDHPSRVVPALMLFTFLYRHVPYAVR